MITIDMLSAAGLRIARYASDPATRTLAIGEHTADTVKVKRNGDMWSAPLSTVAMPAFVAEFPAVAAPVSLIKTAPVPHTFVVVGNGYWGRGATLADAKATFRRHGGRLSDGYTLFTFAGAQEFVSVDGMGYIRWNGTGEPVESQHGGRSAAFASKRAARRA